MTVFQDPLQLCIQISASFSKLSVLFLQAIGVGIEHPPVYALPELQYIIQSDLHQNQAQFAL